MGRHDHHIGWRALLAYGIISLVVLVAGSVTLYSYFEKESLISSIAPEPLPSVTVLTTDPNSDLAAAWIALLIRSDFSPTLVTVGRYQLADDDFVFLCDVVDLPESLATSLDARVRRGGGVAIAGRVPRQMFGIETVTGEAGGAIRIGEAVSPLLARVTPGHEIGVAMREAPLLEESSGMIIDARWTSSSRAAAAHFPYGDGRILWLGFDPSALFVPADRQLALMLRTAFRWAAGQPISEGAVGSPAVARTFAPDARLTARAKKMGYSVDRIGRDDLFSVRIVNKGGEHLENPTVKFWLPPNAKSARLTGSLFLRRRVSLLEVAGDQSVVISLPTLSPYQERIIKLQAVVDESD